MISVLGGQKLSTSDLRQYEVQRPERAGTRWRGIPHYDLAIGLEQALMTRGIFINQEVWSVDQSGQCLIGGMDIWLPHHLGLPAIDGMTYAIAIRHSNDLKRSLIMAVGAKVLICQNGICTGQFILTRKHTTGLDLRHALDDGVCRLVEEARQVSVRVNALKDLRLSQRRVDHILCEAGRRNLLCWSHLGKVESLARTNRHIELFGKNTGFSIYNSFNEVVKTASPDRQISALDGFRKLVLN